MSGTGVEGMSQRLEDYPNFHNRDLSRYIVAHLHFRDVRMQFPEDDFSENFPWREIINGNLKMYKGQKITWIQTEKDPFHDRFTKLDVIVRVDE